MVPVLRGVRRTRKEFVGVLHALTKKTSGARRREPAAHMSLLKRCGEEKPQNIKKMHGNGWRNTRGLFSFAFTLKKRV